MADTADLAVLVASLFHGGVGKMRVHLINEIARRGYKVDLLIADRNSPYMELVDPRVRIINVHTTNAITGVPFVAAYLLRARPRVMLSQRIRVNALALRARSLTRAQTRMFVTANTNMTRELEALRPEKRVRHLATMRRYFPRNDGIIAISQGVAKDLASLIDWPLTRIQVAPNPVVTPDLPGLARSPLDHPWFAPGQPPVIMGVGRLEPQKDFPTLMRAFARVRTQQPARLIILGEGKQRDELQDLATELGVTEDVQIPGFAKNPYAYMARAALFVFSSRWEGLGNVLIEALAIGTPVVSTNCPDGPSEILEEGRYGLLVPVGDVEALAMAMRQTLAHPPERSRLQAAAQRYTLERSATAYIEALGLSPEHNHG
jgi:glycosyltransferase involved in cell wall biosynthesis